LASAAAFLEETMLVLFTDYGWRDPYVGQVKGVLARVRPGSRSSTCCTTRRISMPTPAPSCCMPLPPPSRWARCSSAWWIPAWVGPREAAVVEADGRWFVGPDNGLLSIVAARADLARCWRIHWRPEGLSDTFHGRDLFAPVAARIAAGIFPTTG
jgi:S-adenosylmethionine hydrolase